MAYQIHSQCVARQKYSSNIPIANPTIKINNQDPSKKLNNQEDPLTASCHPCGTTEGGTGP